MSDVQTADATVVSTADGAVATVAVDTPAVPAAATVAPRTLAAVEADLIAAYDALAGMESDELKVVEAWVQKNYERLKSEALADLAAVKAEKAAVVNSLVSEMHAAHEWLTAKISAIF